MPLRVPGDVTLRSWEGQGTLRFFPVILDGRARECQSLRSVTIITLQCSVTITILQFIVTITTLQCSVDIITLQWQCVYYYIVHRIQKSNKQKTRKYQVMKKETLDSPPPPNSKETVHLIQII